MRSLESVAATDDRAGVVESSSLETGSLATQPERGRARLEMVQPDVYNLKFSAGKELKEKLERLGEVLGIVNAERNMPEIFERALDLALEKRDPKEKLERRRKREAAARRSPSPEKVSTEKENKLNETVRVSRLHPSRYISSSVRERVLERAGYQCEFTGTGGVRCTARTGLEIDHIKSYAKAGAPCEENLRALCQAHNLFSAVREFGAEFMRAKIEGRTNDRSSLLPSR